jgi:hypothetical protein
MSPGHGRVARPQPAHVRRRAALPITTAAVLAILTLAVPASALFWTIEIVDHPSNAAVGDASSIVLDSAGRPHIAYRDNTHASVKYARKKANGTWSIETVDSPGFAGSGLSLALDAGGGPHITYYAASSITSTGSVRYASRSCFLIWCSWDKETIASGVFSSSAAGNTSLAFDAQGNPNVSYFDHTTHQLKWAEKTSGSWSSSNVVATAGGSASLALDPDGFPHLSFSDSAAGTVHYVRVMCFFILCGWNLDPIDSGIAGILRLDTVGQPHLTYAQRQNIRYASGACPVNDPCTWTTELVGVAGTAIARLPSLALDSCTTPHVAFLHERGPGIADLLYAKRAGTTWNVETVDLDASSSALVSITVDVGNNPHISYQGLTGQPLKYARGGLRPATAARRRPTEVKPAPEIPKLTPRSRSEQAIPSAAVAHAGACEQPTSLHSPQGSAPARK